MTEIKKLEGEILSEQSNENSSSKIVTVEYISTSIDKLLDEMEILIYDKFNSNYCYDKDEIKQILNKYRE